MFTTKHLTGLLGFLFSLSVLYYNYSYQFNWGYGYHTSSHFAHMPNFAAYNSLAKRKHAFERYITDYVKNDNHFIQQVHVKIKNMQQQFIRTHHLTFTQLYWLNLHFHSMNVMNPYQKSTWQHLLNQTDIVPKNTVLRFSQKNSNNPLSIKQSPGSDICIWNSTILADKSPWLRGPRCYTTWQILSIMQKTSNLIEHKKFYNLTAAYKYYIFTANVSPAYRQFRRLRQQWREQHPYATSWQMVNNTQTLNPDRLYNKHYYIR